MPDTHLGPAATKQSRTGRLPGLLVLAAAQFVALTTELLPVGLLPDISARFDVSPATTGLLVSVYALMVAAFAVPLTLLTRRIGARTLLLGTLAGYVVSSVLVATAPSFAMVAVGRAVGGFVHALFFSVCIGLAARLAAPGRTGAALALVSAGASAGFVLGVPLGTALGHAVGWRVTFSVVAVLAALLLALAAVVLPRVEPDAPAGRPRVLGRRLTSVITLNLLFFVGQYVLYTYVSTLLLGAGTPAAVLGAVLLVFGAAGLVGLAIASRFIDAHLRATLLACVGVIATAMLLIGASYPALVLVLVLGLAWTTAFGPVPTLFQAAAVRTRDVSPEMAGAWINATSNGGIALGAALGGLVLDTSDLRWVAVVATLVVGVNAAVLALRPQALPVG
ncbi:MFS transporter [Nocardioides bruguierae]|uniref:MFS transporter n=1 Tax=Nocardioides bruguierae TaxID=2945102 RepID=UPI00201FE034|nr:MFS transporter [Nocardioides bruguierae]MCL8026459.1 MFS transporter [Nocardioides bruguierae]